MNCKMYGRQKITRQHHSFRDYENIRFRDWCIWQIHKRCWTTVKKQPKPEAAILRELKRRFWTDWLTDFRNFYLTYFNWKRECQVSQCTLDFKALACIACLLFFSIIIFFNLEEGSSLLIFEKTDIYLSCYNELLYTQRQRLLSAFLCMWTESYKIWKFCVLINHFLPGCFHSYGLLWLTSKTIESVDISKSIDINQSISINQFYPIEASNLIREFFVTP